MKQCKGTFTYIHWAKINPNLGQTEPFFLGKFAECVQWLYKMSHIHAGHGREIEGKTELVIGRGGHKQDKRSERKMIEEQ